MNSHTLRDPRLIADVGGTNARFAIAENGLYGEVTRVGVADYASLGDALADYLAKLPGARPTHAVIDVAGPVSGDAVSLTNHPWSFSISKVRSSLGLSALHVVNDFAAAAMAVPYLHAAQTCCIGRDCAAGPGAIGVIGPGTGLGVGALIPSGGKWISIPGEGGHVTLPTATPSEDAVIALLRVRWNHVSAERVLSGAGLVHLYQAVCAIEGRAPEPFAPAEVTDHAIRKTNPECVAAFAHFCAMLGTVASDLAVTLGATGGIYIAGGILLRFKEAFAASGFRARFEDKGRFRGYLERIPTRLILDESPALLGLANADLDG